MISKTIQCNQDRKSCVLHMIFNKCLFSIVTKKRRMKMIKSNIFNSFWKGDIISQLIKLVSRIYMFSVSVIPLELIKLI